MTDKAEDKRYRQANREALLALGVYALYFVWWYGCAYGLGDGDPEGYSFIMGLPEWFFYSCIVGYPLVVLALWLVVRFCFEDMPLDEADAEPGDAPGADGRTPS
ncbi:YhdT family protein [Desulfobaculum sp.]